MQDIVAGFLWRENPISDQEEVVEIVARVSDKDVLNDLGPSFFIKRLDGEVKIATATMLNPWFAF